MGDKDDLIMEGLMERLRDLKDDYGNSYIPSSSNAPKNHVNPWDDPTQKPLYNQAPGSCSEEDSEATEQAKQIILQQGPTGSGKSVSIIRALEKAMQEADEANQKNGSLGRIVNLPKGSGTDGEKVIKITRNTEEGLKDLKQIRLDELCVFVNADVEMESSAGRFLIDLYHGYQLMIKRIVERYPKGAFKDPSEYFEKDIFDSIPDLLDEEDAIEILFELAGDDEIKGGIESLAGMVFDGLNNRFLEKSGWGDRESVMLIQKPNSGPAFKKASRAIPPMSGLQTIPGVGNYMPFDMSGSMNQPVFPRTQDEIDAFMEELKKDTND